MEVTHGDCLDVMRGMEPESVDAVVTDPPYGLEFMGKEWDHGIPGAPFWEAAIRVAKPGAHLLAFGGTRTHHRLMCAIEDAGWEIRDCLMWVYGSGFPKSLDVGKAIDKAAGSEREVIGTHPKPAGTPNYKVSIAREVLDLTAPATDAAKQWDGWGTALKPAWEPIILARKPLVGTVAANVLEYGTGGLNIDGCRVGSETITTHSRGHNTAFPKRPAEKTVEESGRYKRQDLELGQVRQGRWPANVVHDGSEEVVGLFPVTKSGVMKAETQRAAQDEPGSVCYGTFGGNATDADTYGDMGSAARFFYCAKASRSEREAGLDGMPLSKAGVMQDDEYNWERDGKGNQINLAIRLRNHHPTVKPIALMRWLCRLVTPPKGLILDPFCGSFSTGVAAALEGFRCLGIDDKLEYCDIARRRVAHASAQGVLDMS